MKLWKAGWLKGDNNGFFNPKDNAERASAATFCTRIHKGVTKWHEDNTLPSQTPTPSLTATPTPLPSLTPSPSPTPTQTPVPTSIPPSDSDRNYTYYTVSFNSNGGATVDPIRVRSGRTISSLLVPIKENAIFLGWYQDEGLYENEFTKDSVVTSNITLYAKYLIVEEIAEEVLDNSFALIDQNSDLTITIEALNPNMTVTDVKNGISLEDNTGSDSSGLTITGSNGVFTLKGTDGFIEGASYKLILDDEKLTFADQEDYVRICSFTIKKDEVYNIEFNSDIVYIPDSHIEDIVQNNNDMAYMSVPPLFQLFGMENAKKPFYKGLFDAISESIYGGDEGDRTPGLLNAIQTRSQLRHAPRILTYPIINKKRQFINTLRHFCSYILIPLYFSS
jgi:hypothetical protein